ncbi:MAG: HepT-like ribonuclease domain-containing protein [Candidatus Nanopelagicales bacterium]
MIDAADRIRELIGETDIERLRSDSMRREAVLWNYTVLGEAASQIPAEIRIAYPTIEWAQATRLRNRIVHGYWDVDLYLLHGTATEDLPRMSERLRLLLDVLDQE